MVARAIFHRPAVLFMDEPTAGLDPQSRLALWEILGELHTATGRRSCSRRTTWRRPISSATGSRSWTTARSSRSTRRPRSSARSGADTIVTVKTSGDPARVAQRLSGELDGVTRTRAVDGGVELHVTGAERLVPRVVDAAESGGFDVVDLSVAEPTLETVFINLTGKELRD